MAEAVMTILDPALWTVKIFLAGSTDGGGEGTLRQRGDPQPRLVFQPVPEPQTGKVRIHLDSAVDDIDEAMTVVINLGGRHTGDQHDYDEGVVVVMADPEGHQFCLVQYYG